MRADVEARRGADDQEQLARRRAELAAAQTRFRDHEREWVSAVEELRRFEVGYLRALGELLVERSRLLADLAALRARHRDDEQLRDSAAAAAADADSLEEECRASVGDSPAETSRTEPSEDLKALYREVAKRVHPDLAETDADRNRRTQLMNLANQAYAKGDAETLRRLLDGSVAEDLGSDKDDAATDSLALVIDHISATWRRIDRLEASLRSLHASEMWRLKERVEAAQLEGLDLLASVRADLEHEVARLRDELAHTHEAGGAL